MSGNIFVVIVQMIVCLFFMALEFWFAACALTASRVMYDIEIKDGVLLALSCINGLIGYLAFRGLMHVLKSNIKT